MIVRALIHRCDAQRVTAAHARSASDRPARLARLLPDWWSVNSFVDRPSASSCLARFCDVDETRA